MSGAVACEPSGSHLGPFSRSPIPKMVAAPGGKAAGGTSLAQLPTHYTAKETLLVHMGWGGHLGPGLVHLVLKWNDTSRRVWDVGRQGCLLGPSQEHTAQDTGILPSCHHYPGPASSFHPPQEPFPPPTSTGRATTLSPKFSFSWWHHGLRSQEA